MLSQNIVALSQSEKREQVQPLSIRLGKRSNIRHKY